MGGPPPGERERLVAPISELRDPILMIFFLKISKLSEKDSCVFFMGLVTAWSLDPERFRQKLSIYICCPKLF